MSHPPNRRLINSVCYSRPKLTPRPSSSPTPKPTTLSSPNPDIPIPPTTNPPPPPLPHLIRPLLLAEIQYWHQMLSFLTKEWVSTINLIASTHSIPRTDYLPEVQAHNARVAAVRDVIAGLEALRRDVRFPQSIDAVVKVEDALGVWSGLETEVVGFLFKQYYKNTSRLVGVLGQGAGK